jgi:hypothetical protein
MFHVASLETSEVTILYSDPCNEVYNQIKAGTIPQCYHDNALQAADGVLRVESRHTIASLERMRQHR